MKKLNLILLSTLLTGPIFAATEMDALRERLTMLEEQMQAESALSIGGVIEVEYGFDRPKTGENEDEITLATAELGVAANLNENFVAYVTLLYEQGENNDNIIVDEAVLNGQTVGGKYSFALGRQYVPFGVYETALISDPVGLDIGETNNEAIVLSANFAKGFSAAVWGADDSNSGISLGYDNDIFTVGVDWIESVVEDDGENALAIYGSFSWEDFILIAERIAEIDGDNEAESTQVELDYAFDAWTFAVTYNDIDNFGDYDANLGFGVEYELIEGAGLAAEYKTQNRTDNTGNDNVITLRLAYEF